MPRQLRTGVVFFYKDPYNQEKRGHGGHYEKPERFFGKTIIGRERTDSGFCVGTDLFYECFGTVRERLSRHGQ